MECPGAFNGLVCLFGGYGDLESASDVGTPGARGGGFAANVWGVECATDGFLEGIGIGLSAACLGVPNGALRDAKRKFRAARFEQR